jgi:hypothetical protein
MDKIFRRVNGDEIEIRFNDEGKVSSAILYVGELTRNAAPQLPGVTEDNCDEYMKTFGYQPTYSEEELRVGSQVNQVLMRENLMAEYVKKSGTQFILSIIKLDHRKFVCPIRQFLALIGQDGNISFLDSKSQENEKRFLTIFA